MGSKQIMDRLVRTSVSNPFEVLGLDEATANGHDIRKAYRRIALLIHPDKNPGMDARCGEALVKLQQCRERAESRLTTVEEKVEVCQRGPETRSAAKAADANASVDPSLKCRYPGCDLPRCKQCANGCCTRNITHCHMISREHGRSGVQCFFHPPPRALGAQRLIAPGVLGLE